jgi:hypothetical protein
MRWVIRLEGLISNLRRESPGCEQVSERRAIVRVPGSWHGALCSGLWKTKLMSYVSAESTKTKSRAGPDADPFHITNS